MNDCHVDNFIVKLAIKTADKLNRLCFCITNYMSKVLVLCFVVFHIWTILMNDNEMGKMFRNYF